MNQHGWKDKGSIYNEGISIDGKAEDEYITKGGMRRMSKGPQYEGERDVQKDLALSVEKAKRKRLGMMGVVTTLHLDWLNENRF